ncbi:hypothetical protein SASPL_116234 [Salvia splendens]|uniref:Uncharacterized protein n=1 Tax=Salvia splendens TaxID=180675 RepID=A0A8X8XVR8_SALSN|nr:hypothetical protein SASPL_116234 [Salvia splendens]
MDRYQKVEKPKLETPIDENEIRITSQGRMRSYITYAMTLLQEKGSDEVVFKAMGRAINKTVTIVELIKRRIVGLHQITSIQSTDITDTWEPLEEGLQILETTRKVSMVTITLSKKDLDLNNVGYQPPIPADQVKVSTELEYEGGEGSPMGRGRGRGGRGRGRPRGGPADSTVLAYVMSELNRRHDYGLDLFLLSVDEGITGYRDDSLETVKRNEIQYGIPLKVISYKDLYGWTMDEIVKLIGLKNNCTFCGVFRRQALDRGASLLKVDKIVTGHNADDIAETVLLNILRGDIARLSRCTSIITGEDGPIPRCKPFKYTYEKQIVIYPF